jgi:quercetin 2,3-dioxygenase
MTVRIGDQAGTASPARSDGDHAGADLELRSGSNTLPLDPDFEHALSSRPALFWWRLEVQPGHLFYLGAGRDELQLTTTESGRALAFGGFPFPEHLLMWWNFVARTREQIDAAYDDWTAPTERFGQVQSRLPRIGTSRPTWRPPTTERTSNAKH